MPVALVVAGLLRQVGKEVSEAPDREAEELAVVAEAEEDLGDRQADQLGVGDLRRSAGATALGQEVVEQDVKIAVRRVSRSARTGAPWSTLR